MKKIILFSTISVLLSACGGSSSRDNNFANGQNPVVNSVKLSTGQTIQLRGTGVITSVDPNTTVNASTGSSLNNNIQGSTYAGGYASDTSYAFVETNRAGYTSMPQFSGNVSDVPTTGTAIYAGEIYTLKHLQSGDGSNSVVRQVNDGVAVGSARFDVDFASKTISGGGVVNYAHELKEVKEVDKDNPKETKDENGNTVKTFEEVTTSTNIHSYALYTLNDVSFNDLKNGTGKVNILTYDEKKTTKNGLVVSDPNNSNNSNTTDNNEKYYTGTVSGNFYGANAKELVGSVKADSLNATEHNAVFHTRKQ